MPYTLEPDQGFDLDIESTEYLKDHVQGADRWVLNFGRRGCVRRSPLSSFV